MSFHLPEGARLFFKSTYNLAKSDPQLDTLFDIYYLCLMVGLDSRRLDSSVDASEVAEILRAYPADYNANAPLIAGLLIDAELERKGISFEDRDSIEREILRLLDPQSHTDLSQEGHKLLDSYAAAGFASIRDRIHSANDLPSFLLAYNDLFKRASADVL